MEKNNKKIKVIIICISLIMILCVAGILAYFSDTVTVKNKIRMGIVDIELKEYSIDKDGNKIEWKSVKNVLPGETISKIPEITCVKGSADCYIRAKVEIEVKDENLVKHEKMLSIDNVNVDTNKWYYCEEDWYFYYKEIMKDSSESATLFTEVNIPATWTNEWASKEFAINVTAEAIQSKNFTPDFSNNSTNPWPGITQDDIEECIYPEHIK